MIASTGHAAYLKYWYCSGFQAGVAEISRPARLI
jgi:hypothetical protein